MESSRRILHFSIVAIALLIMAAAAYFLARPQIDTLLRKQASPESPAKGPNQPPPASNIIVPQPSATPTGALNVNVLVAGSNDPVVGAKVLCSLRGGPLDHPEGAPLPGSQGAI